MTPAPVPAPTRTRYKVLAFTVALAAVTYMDRVCISITAPHISRDLGLSDIQMSLVFSAFTLAYGLFEIPTGWWGDRIGTRRVLTRIVAWWSTFTIVTAGAFNYASLLLIRFLFGAGEAGAWPNAARTLSRWFPSRERGTAQGIFFTGAHFGAAVTPIIVASLLRFVSWRSVFVIFGCIGFVWAAAWFRWFRDEPSEHSSVNASERSLIESGRAPLASHHDVPWRRILMDRNVALLCVMYFVQTYGFYFYITWMPTYLQRERGFSALNLGVFSGLPMVACMISDVLGGAATDAMSRRFGLRPGRAIVGGSSFVFASLFIVLGAAATDPSTAAILLAIAAGWSTFCLGAAWGTCLDIAGPNAGVVSACMNTAGQVGGFLSPILLALMIQTSGNWSLPLYITGGLFTLGALAWCFIDPRREITTGIQ